MSNDLGGTMSVCVDRLAAALEATRRLGCELKALIELRQQIAQLESTLPTSTASRPTIKKAEPQVCGTAKFTETNRTE
jgi:hypothetical protein